VNDRPNNTTRVTVAEAAQPAAFPSLRFSSLLEQQLRDAGMYVLSVSEAGDVLRMPARGEDWLGDLLCYSQLFRSVLARAARVWGQQHEPAAMEVIPGLHLVPVPLLCRRRRTGYSVAVIVTRALLGDETAETGHRPSETATPTADSRQPSAHSPSEHLAAMCQSARLDLELTKRWLVQLPTVEVSEVDRLVKLVRHLHAAHAQVMGYESDIEATGQQLAESYEEISLLYTITQSMRVVQQPERFVRLVCEELLVTLPYSWVGVLMSDDLGVTETSALRQTLAGEFIVVGKVGGAGGGGGNGGGGGDGGDARAVSSSHPLTHSPTHGLLRSLAGRLLAEATPNTPQVIEPLAHAGHEPYRAFGTSALVHPVSSESNAGGVMGVIIAGDKRGPDQSASSVDMKLLGATANHMAIFLENASLYDNVNTMFLGTLEALTASIDAKDRYTCGHSRRVAHLTQQLARAAGMDEAQVERMHIAGLVHDVGKIGVPERVLLKPGKLTDDEFAWIRRHPEMGYRILKDIPQLSDVLPGVLYHHERWDGCGYPKGLKGDEIPYMARLIGLADAFDAMSSTRTYRSAMDRRQVLREIERCAGSQFDPELVPVFVKLDFGEFDRMVAEHRAASGNPLVRGAA
jgi:HD-GYP domain-containing protein (c-di-GMP phosphodiesterase class II)